MAAQQTHRPPGDRDELIVTLFLAAMSRPEEERGPFLRQACAHDEALRAEVERRVKWEARLGGFLLTPLVPRERFDRPFAPGDTVLDGRFSILSIAGEGGMGVVYEAFDRKLDRRVALKCPRFEFRKRLPPEAMKALSVAHDNVCKVYGVHTEKAATGEVDFFTMEFLAGETLASRLERAPARWLESQEGRLIAHQLCDGLAAVHAQGIVHRDLKASNVMLTARHDGSLRAVIMDFGIAQGADLFSSSVRGTPAYLAPELWKGQPATVQSDLYALGVLLYEMAAGRQPFDEGVSWEQRLESPPPAPDVGEPLRSAVMRCLRTEPAHRFQSVVELKNRMWRRSRRWLLGVAAAGVAGLFVKERWWPSSAVRLAVVPPVIPGSGTAEGPLIDGFLHDLSYRFKTLRKTRRPLSVFSLAQTADEIGLQLSATHVLAAVFELGPGGWNVSVKLEETPGRRTVRRWNSQPSRDGLAAQLFALQSAVVTGTIAQLALQAEARVQSLPREAYADYLQGLHFARVDYENAPKAIPLFEKVIAAAPDSALGYAGLAEALQIARYTITRDKSLEGRALAAIARAEQLDPDLAHVHLVAGRLSFAGGNYERALASYRRAAELGPNDAEPYMEMARALGYLNRLPEAEAAYQTAFAVQPTYYKPYLLAGGHYYELRDFTASEKYFLEAVRLAPGQTRARLNLASMYLTMGRIADAETQTLESLKIKRTRSALETLAALHERAGRYAESVVALEEAVSVGPNYYATWLGLGEAYDRVGRRADAVRAYRKGVEECEWGMAENPRDAYRIVWCALYHAKLGEVASARARVAQAWALRNPSMSSIRKYAVLVYDLIHDTQAALGLLQDAPAGLLKEFAANKDLTPELRSHPRFKQLTDR